jgi:signal transduction histidine kinase/ActR/RegA family two-component response regulator
VAVPAADPAASFILAHLDSLKEIQNTLALEGRDDGILREGTTGIVEIVGADCAIAVIDAANGFPGMRFGWSEGRHMATHEIEVIYRRLQDAVAQVRQGRASRVLLGTDLGAGGPEGDARAAPADAAASFAEQGVACRTHRFGSVLILDAGAGVGRRGVLILARHEAVPFAREQMLLAEILAAQMTIQIDRARRANDARRISERLEREVEEATGTLRERNRELTTLNAIATVSAPSLDPDRQVEGALRKAIDLTRHVLGAIHLTAEEDGVETLRFAHGSGDAAALDRLRALPAGRGRGIRGRVLERGEPLALSDLAGAAEFEEADAVRRSGCRGLVCVPLRARGRAVGTLLLAADDGRRYGEADLGLMQAIGDQMAVVLQNARVISDVMHYSLDLESRLQHCERDLRRRDAEAEALRIVLEAGGRPSDLRGVLEDAMAQVVRLLGEEGESPGPGGVGAARARVQAACVHLIDPRSRALQLRAHHGMSPESVQALGTTPVGRTLVGRAFEAGEAHAAEPAGGSPRDAEDRLDVTGLRILAAAPLRTGGGVHGVVSVAGRNAEAIDPEELAILDRVGRLLGMVVENRRAFQEAAPGGGAGAAGTGKDLPPQLVMAQKMESVGTLASGIAHEFNNILGAILGYASHIKGLTTSDNPIHRQAVVIEQQAVRAAELTKQLLAFARGGQYALARVDLNDAVREVASFLQKSAGPRIAVEVQTEPDLPLVEADVDQMRQAILNVAVNAVDAMPEGGRISLETRVASLDRRFVQSCPGLQPGDYVQVVVGDTGVGMAPEIADRAFEPFFTTKTGRQGTGLGLSVVYGIVRNHGGHVALESTPGLGTTVRLYVPAMVRDRMRVEPPRPGDPGPAGAELAGAVPAAVVPPAAEPEAGPVPGGTAPSAARVAGRILIVDDEQAIREMMKDILESAGYEVVLAPDGVEALEVYRQEWGRVSLVLLDMVMPRMSGLETFRRIQGMDRSARVILCSGYADNAQAQQAIKEGALGFFPKPFTMSELLARVRRVIGGVKSPDR